VVLLLKYGRERFLRYVLLGAFTFIGIVVVIYFGYTFLVVFWELDAVLACFILVAFALTAVLGFIMVGGENRVKNGGLLVFGSGVGAFLGVVLPVWTSLLLLIAIAVYDYISVKKGPIRKIVELTEDNPEKLAALSVSSAEWDIGLGDVAFYGMMTVLAVVNFGFIPTVCTIIGVIAGFLTTLRLLEKRGVMAGLPIPVSLGLLGLLIGFLLRLFLPFLP
jgi:presenilin-like A22 family membrane protease